MRKPDTVLQGREHCTHCGSSHFYATEGYTMRAEIKHDNPGVMVCYTGQGDNDGFLYFECVKCGTRYSCEAVDTFETV